MPRSLPRATASTLLALSLLAGVALPGRCLAAARDSLAATLIGLGFENIGVAPGDTARVGFENRRYRHSAEALGRMARVVPGPWVAIERRYSLPAAAVTTTDGTRLERVQVEYQPGGGLASASLRPTVASTTEFDVKYPTDPGFPAVPRIARGPTSHSIDLAVGPVFTYELGRLFTPFLYRIDIETMLRWNPWPGALARGSVIVPGHDDFELDPQHPDVDRVRPGRLSLEQYRWVPDVGLGSLTAGYFGDNRYGASLGLARPLDEGRFALDAQGEITGFLAFTTEGTEYSQPRRWTGFVGGSWHPGLDLTARVRRAWFLSGDAGYELQLSRALGDFDVAGFAQHTNGDNVVGVRLAIPIPPFTRATGAPVRVMPIERFHLTYHSRSEPIGVYVSGVASREEFLRQLDAPALQANLDRYRRARGEVLPAAPPASPPALISLTGTTGFINTPWAGVMTDRGLEVGLNHVPRRWAYDQRDLHANDIYYATLGFLPRIEASARWTVIPGLKSFAADVPDSRLTDTDYMASGRLALLEPGPGRPGLAIGVDDIKGTRRFHSTYAVAGLPFEILGVHQRATLGYAFRALKARRRTLDGAFGAVEWSRWSSVAVQLEYDTEKWNTALAVATPFGIRLRAALLHMQSLSLGAGIYLPLR